MKYKIIFSENAKRDLISIVRYISDELLEPNIAEKLSYRILKAINLLMNFQTGIDYVIIKNGKTKDSEFYLLRTILYFTFLMSQAKW